MLQVAFVIVVTLLLSACATSPLGHKQLQLISDEKLSEMAAAEYQQTKQEKSEVSDPRIKRYVNCVAEAIIDEVDSDTSWELTVFDEPEVVNATAWPGGKIAVYTGLLNVAKTPDQLAAVLGHEVAHVLAEHGNAKVSATLATQAGLAAAQILTQILTEDESEEKVEKVFGLVGLGAQYGVLLPYGRTQETEADLLGLDLMASAGFNPRESVDLWRNMAQSGGQQPPEFMSTHPSHETRIQNLRQRMPRALEIYQQAGAQGKTPDCG